MVRFTPQPLTSEGDDVKLISRQINCEDNTRDSRT
jgi:hypothetical protein